MRRIKKQYRFPWREGNRFELLVDGEDFFPAMLQAIDDARDYVLLEIYLFKSGKIATQFIDALIKAVKRDVEVYLLLDDFGAKGLERNDRLRLIEAGANLTYYNPLRYGKLRRNLFRDHRKLLIVDGAVAFVGGVGITDDFRAGRLGHGPWHETVACIRGPNVADWQEVFEQNWNLWSGPNLDLLAVNAKPVPGGLGRIVTNSPSRMEIKRSLIKRIRGAEHRVWIATAYFIPSRKIRRALRHAARRGVDVRLLLPGRFTDHPAIRHAGRRFYGRLLRNRVRIFEYQPSFLHAKFILCDSWVSIGSSNIDRWNLRWNLEGNQEVEDQSFTDSVKALFEKDFAQSQEYHDEKWHHRWWYQRLPEWFWGKVDLWLERRTRIRSRDDEPGP